MSDAAAPAVSTSHAGAGRAGLVKDVLVNAALPYATFLLLRHYDVATLHALVAGAVFPTAATVLAFVRERRVQALGLIVLAATAASVVGALAFTSAYMALLKESVITGFIGLTFAASLLARRPLVFHLSVAGKDAAARRHWELLWASMPEFRRVMRQLTTVWAVGLLAEATLRVVLILLLPIAVFLPVSASMWIAFIALLSAWSWRYGRRLVATLPNLPAPRHSLHKS
jgi:hypothetical protein